MRGPWRGEGRGASGEEGMEKRELLPARHPEASPSPASGQEGSCGWGSRWAGPRGPLLPSPPAHRPATRVSGPVLRLSGPGARTSSRGDAQPSSDTRPPHGHFLLGTQSPGPPTAPRVHTPLPTADPPRDPRRALYARVAAPRLPGALLKLLIMIHACDNNNLIIREPRRRH